MNFFQAFIHRMFMSAIRQAGIWAMPAIGTKRTFRNVRDMSVMEGMSEVKYSLRVFRILTRCRHRENLGRPAFARQTKGPARP